MKNGIIFWGVTEKHDGDFYSLSCRQSYRTEKKLRKHYDICKNHDYCYVEMPNDGSKVLKYANGEKSFKYLSVIYSDLECVLKKIHSCQNDPKKSYTEKK